MAQKIVMTKAQQRKYGTFVMLAYLAGEEKLRSKKLQIEEIIDLLTLWAKEFDRINKDERWSQVGECWDDKLYTFLFEKIGQTQELYEWTDG